MDQLEIDRLMAETSAMYEQKMDKLFSENDRLRGINAGLRKKNKQLVVAIRSLKGKDPKPKRNKGYKNKSRGKR